MLELTIDPSVVRMASLVMIALFPIRFGFKAYEYRAQAEHFFRINKDDPLWRLCYCRAIFNVLLMTAGLAFYGLMVIVMVYKP